MGWVEKYADPRNHWRQKGLDGSTLSARELVEQKEFLCCSVNPNSGKEQRKETEGFGFTNLFVSICLFNSVLRSSGGGWQGSWPGLVGYVKPKEGAQYYFTC